MLKRTHKTVPPSARFMMCRGCDVPHGFIVLSNGAEGPNIYSKSFGQTMVHAGVEMGVISSDEASALELAIDGSDLPEKTNEMHLAVMAEEMWAMYVESDEEEDARVPPNATIH